MKKQKILIPLAVLICLLLVTASLALPADLSIPWWTVDSGGGQSTGGGYTLRGAIGQPDSGLLQGGQYRLSGGFWTGPLTKPPTKNLTYLPAIFR